MADKCVGDGESERPVVMGLDSRVAPLAVGVVGCGYWGSKHLRVLATTPGVGRVLAFDRDRERSALMACRFPGVEVVDSAAELFTAVDAVIVATPPRTHGAVADAALRAGCHVLVEKPLAVTVEEAEALVVASASRGLVLMSGHTFEYNPAVWKLRELIQRGELGRVYHVNTARLNLGLYQGDVNVVWDLAPHDVSILNHVLDSRPTCVSVWAGAHAHNSVEDVAYLRLHYDEIGVVAQVHLSWLDPCKVRRVTVVGSRKMVIYDDLAEGERIKVFDKGVDIDGVHHGMDPADATEIGARPLAYREGGVECPSIDFEEPLAVEVRSFVRSIQYGVDPPSDGRSGLAVVQVLAAAERSLRTGQPVEVDYRWSQDRDPAPPIDGAAIAAGLVGHRNGRTPRPGARP